MWLVKCGAVADKSSGPSLDRAGQEVPDALIYTVLPPLVSWLWVRKAALGGCRVRLRSSRGEVGNRA
jgi:hypothetical protein